MQHGAQSLAGAVLGGLELRRVDAGEATARRAGADQGLEVGAHRLRRVELLHRQHRPDAVDELEHAAPVDRRRAAVGDGFVVAAFDVSRQMQRLPGNGRAVIARLAGQARDRPVRESQADIADQAASCPTASAISAAGKREAVAGTV